MAKKIRFPAKIAAPAQRSRAADGCRIGSKGARTTSSSTQRFNLALALCIHNRSNDNMFSLQHGISSTPSDRRRPSLYCPRMAAALFMTLPVNFDSVGVDAILADWLCALSEHGVDAVAVLGPNPTGGRDDREVLAIHPPRLLGPCPGAGRQPGVWRQLAGQRCAPGGLAGHFQVGLHGARRSLAQALAGPRPPDAGAGGLSLAGRSLV